MSTHQPPMSPQEAAPVFATSDDAARKAWFDQQKKAFVDAAAGAAKTAEVAHPPVAM